jgi:hypothetical protein
LAQALEKSTDGVEAMLITLKRDLNRIKNGWSAGSPELGLAAHGYSPEVADRNLERTARLFLAPSQRAGTLTERVIALGLRYRDDNDDLQVVVE